MLESGIGRAHNIALATLEQFTLPGDISSSSKYWEEDIIEPEISVYNGKIALPDNPGIGFHVSREKLKNTLLKRKYLPYKQNYPLHVLQRMILFILQPILALP